MNLALAETLRCPTCRRDSPVPHAFETTGDGRCAAGVLVCGGCGAWYPISNRVLDLLPEARAQPGSRARFFAGHRDRLEGLGLRPPGEGGPDPGFAEQAHQREHFDDLARREDRYSYEALGRQAFQRALRSLTFEDWMPLIRPGTLALDIGCADGLSTFDLARFGVEVVGCDISPEGLSRAATRAQSEGIRNVSFMVADANSIPVASGGVDCVLCYGSLHHMPDPARTIGEAARVLSAGGVYLGVENHTTPLRPLFDALMKLRPIWLEEAGSHAQIGAVELERWSDGTGLGLEAKPIVFVPPHLCNWIGERAARFLLRVTDALFGRVPFIRRWGGLISISGRKLGATAAEPFS